jgi:hypothetical protein
MFSSTAYCQQADFIVLKKNQKTVKNFYSGTHIEFVATNGAYRNALITGIKNDSLYLQEFIVYRMPTTLGTYILDTTGSFSYAYHYNQIKSFGKPQKGFNVGGSGAARNTLCGYRRQGAFLCGAPPAAVRGGRA